VEPAQSGAFESGLPSMHDAHSSRDQITRHRNHAKLVRAISVLHEAFDYAHDVDADHWDFAVEIDELRRAGLMRCDLRWLICQGLLAHAREKTRNGDAHRTFEPLTNLQFGKRTCFMLTEAGRELAAELLSVAPAAAVKTSLAPWQTPRIATPETIGSQRTVAVPHWDRDRQELSVAGRVVKRFKVPAANQETVLAAFQEEHWPPRIDDPLPPRPDQDPKRRLHDTINSLNRNQKTALLRFLGDGSGQGVRWELAVTSARSG
jgi:hypothetical protein